MSISTKLRQHTAAYCVPRQSGIYSTTVMQMNPRSFSLTTLATLLVATSVPGCSEDTHTADAHHVYFVGYVYDGAKGTRLTAKELTAISIKYRDKVIKTTIEPDGRYVTTEPLPTWQDYAVYIGAAGYRPFVSRNPGIDVPRSLGMTNALSNTATTQTFQVDAYLFPTALKAPPVTLSIEKADALTASPAPVRAAGTIRLRPESPSLLERAPFDPTGGASASPTGRRWANDEDLLNQTVTRPFTDGRVQIAAGELAYGVPYQIAVFDVADYQPIVLTGQQALVAGVVTSRSITLPKELKEPLRILSTNSESCMPPAGTANEIGARIDITFNEPVEFVGNTWAEDIDNGVSITPSGSSTTPGGGYATYCTLKMSIDPGKQERGTQVAVLENVVSIGFNPSVGISNVSSYGSPCTIPQTLTSVVYGNLANVFLRPKGDSSRRRSLGTMVAETMQSSGGGVPPVGGPYGSLACGSRPGYTGP